MPRAQTRKAAVDRGRGPSVPAEEASTPDQAGRRKERKRVTDRDAQREHRKRKKQYVEELEAKIEFMKTTSCSDQVATLLKENEDLRQQLLHFKNFFQDVQSLVGVLQPVVGGEKVFSSSAQDHGTLQQHPIDAVRTKKTTIPTTDRLDQSANSPGAMENLLQNLGLPHVPTSQESVADWQMDLSNYPMSEDHQVVTSLMDIRNSDGGLEDDDMATGISLPSDTDYQIMPATVDPLAQGSQGGYHTLIGLGALQSHSKATPQGTRGSTIPLLPETAFFDPSFRLLYQPWHTVLNPSHIPGFEYHAPNMFGFPTQTIQQHIDQPGLSFLGSTNGLDEFHGVPPTPVNRMARPSTQPLKPTWLCMPLLMSPPMPADSRLQLFMQDYRHARIQSTIPRPGRPSVLNFLVKSPSEPLSEAVKQYLTPLRASMELPELLACYWIISLLARWHINQDEESFNDLPSWLRPTNFQMKITHPLTVWFMPWPLMRDKILMSGLHHVNSITEIMVKLGVNMKVDLSLTQALQTVMAAETLVHQSNPTTGHKFPFAPTSEEQSAASTAPERWPTGLDSDLVHNVLSDLRNWKLHDRFFMQFPDLKEAYQEAQRDVNGQPLVQTHGPAWL